MKCPECHYVATWLPKENQFAPALDMFPNCHQVTARLNEHPEERAKVSGDPRKACTSMRNEWVRLMKEKTRKQP